MSELDMMNLWAKQLTGYKSQWDRLFDFGYAIEAEVRKQDTALIRQLVDALEHATAWAEEWRFAPAWVADAQAAICVAGVWLEGKP